MLPKPEKTKKLNKNLLSDSEITQESEEVIAAKRLKTKRRLILVSLCLTVGLSFAFWSFRYLQSFINSSKTFSFSSNFNFQLPKIKFNQASSSRQNSSSDFDLQNFLKNKNWSVISILTHKNQASFNFNYDNSSPLNDIDEFNSVKKTSQSLINLNLPQGLLFQEKLNSADGIFYQNLITLPSSQLLIAVKIPGTSDIESINSSLSQLIDLLYWYSVSQLNSD